MISDRSCAWLDELPILTPADMRKTEEQAFAQGVPSLVLMEHAAEAVTDALEEALGGDCRGKRALFLCGTGNNGGDGLAAARLFSQRGGCPTVWLSGEPKTPDAKTQLKWLVACREADIRNIGVLPPEEWPFTEGCSPKASFDGYVDALLGTGLKGRPDEITARLINVPYHDFSPIHHPVIAVDIPSGINGLTGEAFGGAYVHADVTVTFHAPKPGLFLTKDREAVGRVMTVDIGLWDMMRSGDCLALAPSQLNCRMLLPRALARLGIRPLAAHKGDCGRVLIYAGSMGMAGAAAMCAKAAVTAGAGLTTIACPREIIPILQASVPNAMCMDIAEAVESPPSYDVLVVGPGLSQHEDIWALIQGLFDPTKPSVWDADALNLLAKHPYSLGKNAVITPHPGEAARLLGWSLERVLAARLAAARALCEKYGCTVALKSDVTVLCEINPQGPQYLLNATGSPALAKGGSGDVLAGILAVCLHERALPLEAAALACLWHGLAGIAGEKAFGQRELTSDELIRCLYPAEKEARKNF